MAAVRHLGFVYGRAYCKTSSQIVKNSIKTARNLTILSSETKKKLWEVGTATSPDPYPLGRGTPLPKLHSPRRLRALTLAPPALATWRLSRFVPRFLPPPPLAKNPDGAYGLGGCPARG